MCTSAKKFYFHYHHGFLKNSENHVYTGEIVFYFDYHHRKQFRRCTHEFPGFILVGMYGVQYNPTRTILVGMYGVQYGTRMEYSEYSTYSAETHVYTGEIVFYFHYHHCFFKEPGNSCVHRQNCFLFPLSSSKTISPVYT
mgnify:CR=1 FL=1